MTSIPVDVALFEQVFGHVEQLIEGLGTVKTIILDVAVREQSGTSASKSLRKQGRLPAVVYNNETMHSISIAYKDFVNAAQRSRTSQVFTFKSDSKELDGMTAIVKEIQKEYLKGGVLHVDFQLLKESEPVRVSVPLSVSGEAVGVKKEGGILTTSCHKIEVKCLPAHIPDIVDVDITELKLGQRIRTGDLKLPEGVQLVGNPLEVVAGVVTGRQARLLAQQAEQGAAA